jgi:hypothetical protein
VTRLVALLATLVADLTEAGVAIHDCDGPGRPSGGCWLTPTAADDLHPPGMIVAWTCADSLAEGRPGGDRWAAYRGVQDTMTEALWAVLEAFGFPVLPFGQHGVPLVIGARPAPPVHGRPWDVEDLSGDPELQGRAPPVHGEPLDTEVIDADGRVGRCCACCGRPFTALHYPEAREGSGVCCKCWDGCALVASDDHPEGEWLQLGRCNRHPPGEDGTQR